jgi:hypothetical protein
MVPIPYLAPLRLLAVAVAHREPLPARLLEVPAVLVVAALLVIRAAQEILRQLAHLKVQMAVPVLHRLQIMVLAVAVERLLLAQMEHQLLAVMAVLAQPHLFLAAALLMPVVAVVLHLQVGLLERAAQVVAEMASLTMLD